MTRATSFTLSAAILFLLAIGSVQAQNPGQFGILIYNGPTSADLYLGKLTNPQFSRVEFFRGAKKLGEITAGGPNGGIVTDNGLVKGNYYTYEYRAYPASGGTPVTNVVATAVGPVVGGEIKGYLTRRDEVAIQADLTDSLFIMPSGVFIGDAVVPGGDFHIRPGGYVSYDATFAGKVLGIKVYGSLDAQQTPGKFTATGGTLRDLNITSTGQVGPCEGLTFIASDIFILSSYPSSFSNCIFTWLTDQNRNDFAFVDDKLYNITMTGCTVRNESTIQGVSQADGCIVEYDGIIRGKSFTNCTFRNNGQAQLRPTFTPTSMTHSTFQSNGSVSLSNQSTVQYNVFEATCIITISSLSAGFPSNAVDSVHINFNEFQREGVDGTIISIVDCDTIDLTKNYWGQCTGPTNSQRLGRRAHFDPFLRALYPRTSYWLDIGPDKRSITANGEDSVTFSMHMYEVLSGRDSVGARINYEFRIMGSTLTTGQAITDASGRATVSVKVPYTYKDAISLEAYFTATQCIDMAYLIAVGEPEGADLEVLEAAIIQVNEMATSIIADKSFAVRAIIGTTEAVPSPFKVRVEVNGKTYDTFYVYKKQNVGIQYQMENPVAEIALPGMESPTLIIPIPDAGLSAGPFNVVVTVDPPDAVNTKGRIIESNDNNNVLTISGTAISTRWGNDGSANATIFVQPFDNMPTGHASLLPAWRDSTLSFIERAWPMNKGQLSVTIDPRVADYQWIYPDTLRPETWQYYIMKSYKIMRTANPMYDRYVFAVHRDWFGSRLHQYDFARRLSQTLSWSGIYDLSVTSSQSHYFLAHDLGHSFGLRRQDLDPTNEDQMEQYQIAYIGLDINDGMDTSIPRVIHTGTRNKADQLQKSHCFMGNAKLANSSYNYTRWISEFEYSKLMSRQKDFTGYGNPSAGKAILVEGMVDSTTKHVSFGPWVKIDQAVYSSMMDSTYSTHTIKFLDAAGSTLSRYFYRPTFVALGLDEAGENPQFTKEYFAFVAPFSDAVKRVIVESNGSTIAERIITSNAPVVDITYPQDGSQVKASDSVIATWRATDTDGETTFWYTVYVSDDDGATWKLIYWEGQDSVATRLNVRQGSSYKLRVIASDGVNTSEKIISFSGTIVSAPTLPTPGAFALHQNYPNPFNPTTTIVYDVPSAGPVAIRILDMHGQVVRTLKESQHAAGRHTIELDARDLASGVYVYRLEAGATVITRMMHLMK